MSNLKRCTNLWSNVEVSRFLPLVAAAPGAHTLSPNQVITSLTWGAEGRALVGFTLCSCWCHRADDTSLVTAERERCSVPHSGNERSGQERNRSHSVKTASKTSFPFPVRRSSIRRSGNTGDYRHESKLRPSSTPSSSGRPSRRCKWSGSGRVRWWARCSASSDNGRPSSRSRVQEFQVLQDTILAPDEHSQYFVFHVNSPMSSLEN